jgi:GNAT superfamily N-acetyltransferase
MRQRSEKTPAPGMLAYIDGEPVGWCGLGPHSEFTRLARSRTIPVPDDAEVWAVVCFLIRTGFRRRGVASALLKGAVEYARASGASAIEGYPIDPGGRRINATSAYVGTTSMFESAGFRRVLETSAHSAGLPRWVMRLDF